MAKILSKMRTNTSSNIKSNLKKIIENILFKTVYNDFRFQCLYGFLMYFVEGVQDVRVIGDPRFLDKLHASAHQY